MMAVNIGNRRKRSPGQRIPGGLRAQPRADLI